MVDEEEEENRRMEESFVSSFEADPDFDMRYPLSAIISIVSTPPPKELLALRTPTMFLVPARGFFHHISRICMTDFHVLRSNWLK